MERRHHLSSRIKGGSGQHVKQRAGDGKQEDQRQPGGRRGRYPLAARDDGGRAERPQQMKRKGNVHTPHGGHDPCHGARKKIWKYGFYFLSLSMQ